MAKKKEIQLSFTEEEKEVMREVSDVLITRDETLFIYYETNYSDDAQTLSLLKYISKQIELQKKIKGNFNIIFNKGFYKHTFSLLAYEAEVNTKHYTTDKKLQKSILDKIEQAILNNKEFHENTLKFGRMMEKQSAKRRHSVKKEIKSETQTAKVIKLKSVANATPRKRTK